MASNHVEFVAKFAAWDLDLPEQVVVDGDIATENGPPFAALDLDLPEQVVVDGDIATENGPPVDLPGQFDYDEDDENEPPVDLPGQFDYDEDDENEPPVASERRIFVRGNHPDHWSRKYEDCLVDKVVNTTGVTAEPYVSNTAGNLLYVQYTDDEVWMKPDQSLDDFCGVMLDCTSRVNSYWNCCGPFYTVTDDSVRVLYWLKWALRMYGIVVLDMKCDYELDYRSYSFDN